MDSGMQGKAKKTKGLRSKRRPHQFPPLNAVAVGNTISDYAQSAVYNFFSPLELEIADALVMLARGVVSEADSKSKMAKIPKMHECTACGCGLKFSSGQALGGHKRAHYEGVITRKRKRVAVAEPESEYGAGASGAEKKPKFDDV
ncbi:zinc finger protein ZAT5-like protein [Carex littledalei]|uniref:Zinc finger protein ZAT5-like protein n=1 Tax=Carex littledalei TaxID=544730 RepID=A0A833QSU4_9POAL|nr:zinc finger protein ZAT5-like protein [Carex littledalei]